MSFYATREFQFGEVTYYKGDEVESITPRLKQLGLVEEILEVKEELLTEQSSDVEVEVKEEVEEPKVRTPRKRTPKKD